MLLSENEHGALQSILGALSDSAPGDALREQVGASLTRLLHADFMASFVWDPDAGAYGAAASLNHDPQHLKRYEDHYQFHDPVTPVMAAYRKATVVDAVIDRTQLERSEFYCDFLAVDGLHHGINYFAYRDGRHLGDLRLWRAKHRSAFTQQDEFVLEIVGRALAAQLPTPGSPVQTLPQAIAAQLTERERQIVQGLAQGLSDSDIALRFGISRPTVRTHLSHIFDKLNVRTRLGVVSAVRASR